MVCSDTLIYFVECHKNLSLVCDLRDCHEKWQCTCNQKNVENFHIYIRYDEMVSWLNHSFYWVSPLTCCFQKL